MPDWHAVHADGLGHPQGAKLTAAQLGVVAANRGLKDDGLYAIGGTDVHGLLITHVGFFLSVPSLWNVAVFTVAWTCMVRRMHTEERVLSSSRSSRPIAPRCATG
jgi:hypothetical protein